MSKSSLVFKKQTLTSLNQPLTHPKQKPKTPATSPQNVDEKNDVES
jgi:hypothetical protein